MAAKTPSAVLRESVGSLTLQIATFSDIDNGDTWASGIQGIVGAWGSGTDVPTQGTEGIDIGVSGSTLTFSTGEDNRAGKIFVLYKS